MKLRVARSPGQVTYRNFAQPPAPSGGQRLSPVVRRLSPGELARQLQQAQPERSDAQSKIPRLRSEVLDRTDALDDEIIAN